LTTPLTTTRVKVLAAIKGGKLYAIPTFMKMVQTLGTLTSSHNDHRHDTKECQALKTNLERLIVIGYL
jgi:hypothetical protein